MSSPSSPNTTRSLYEIARSIGCTLSHWPLRLQDGRWRLDLDELAAAITPRRGCS